MNFQNHSEAKVFFFFFPLLHIILIYAWQQSALRWIHISECFPQLFDKLIIELKFHFCSGQEQIERREENGEEEEEEN